MKLALVIYTMKVIAKPVALMTGKVRASVIMKMIAKALATIAVITRVI